MEWLTTQFGFKEISIGAGALLLFLWLARKRVVSFGRFLWAANKTLHETETQLTAAAERREQEARRRCEELTTENNALKAEIQQLSRELIEETRKVLQREQINSEDTLYIRALTRRLQQKGIDYSDINEEFARDD